MFNLTPTVRLLLFVNIGVFFVTSSLSESIVNRFALHSVLSDQFSPIQFITHLFMHAGFGHLFSNMLGLIVFGPLLEQFWGPRRFFTFYLLTGLGAAALYLGVNYYETAALVDSFNAYRGNPTNGEFLGFINQHAPSIYDPLEPFIQKFDAAPTNPAYIEQGVRYLSGYVGQQMDTPMVGGVRSNFWDNNGVWPIVSQYRTIHALYTLSDQSEVLSRCLCNLGGVLRHIPGAVRQRGALCSYRWNAFAYIIIKFWESQRKTFY